MVNIFCDNITQELIIVAMQISHTQREVVRLVAPTDTLEVMGYEEDSQGETEEAKEERKDQEY